MTKYDYDAIKPQVPAFRKAVKTTPDRMGNVLILLAFAGGAVVLWIVCFAMIYSKHEYMQWAGYFSVGTLSLIIIWIAIDRKAIQTIEDITGHDIDQDGYVGQPPSMAVETHYSATQMELDRLPGPPATIQAWAQTALEDGSLAYSTWEGRFGTHVTPTGRKVELYRAFREVCRARNLITEQGTHSCELTDHGRNYFRAVLSGKQTPLLEG